MQTCEFHICPGRVRSTLQHSCDTDSSVAFCNRASVNQAVSSAERSSVHTHRPLPADRTLASAAEFRR